MTKAERDAIKEMPTVAYISAFGGLEIKKIEDGIETYVTCLIGAWSGRPSVHRRMVEYTVEGRPYIRVCNSRAYIDEAIRC